MKGETSGRGDGQFPPQERDALVLAQRVIVEARRRGGEELGDRALVHVGVLPEIDRREMEAEHVDGALQARAGARARGCAPPVALQRLRDRREIGG